MDTTAPLDSAHDATPSELLRELSETDAAEAPRIAEELAARLSTVLDDGTETNRQLDFDGGVAP